MKMIEFHNWLDKKIMREASYPDFKNVVCMIPPVLMKMASIT